MIITEVSSLPKLAQLNRSQRYIIASKSCKPQKHCPENILGSSNYNQAATHLTSYYCLRYIFLLLQFRR